MQRIPFIAACLLVGALQPGPHAAAAQAEANQTSPATAQDTLALTLQEARRLALTRNPAFLAERQETEVARGGLRQARVYDFNPELEFEAPGAADGNALGRYEVSLTQEIGWGGQRGARIQAARLGLEGAEARVRNAARQTLAEVSEAYYAAYAAQRRLDVTRELMVLNERLLGATRTQLREGEISVMDANLAEIEVGRARARVLTAQRVFTESRLDLQRLTGIAPDDFVVAGEGAPLPAGPAAGLLSTDSLIAIALSRRPDLDARAREVEQAHALTSLAHREAIPNLQVGALAERETARGETRIGVIVRVPVPLWNRNQGRIAQHEAMAVQDELDREATELAIRTEVTSALRAYRSAVEEARIFAEDVIEPARQNQALLEIAYREGKINLATLLLLRNQLLDAEFGYWEAWLAERRGLTRLQAATGELGGDTYSSAFQGGHDDR